MLKKLVAYIQESKVVKAYSTSVLGVFSGLLTQLLLIKELTKVLSTSEFSLYAFVFQIVSYITIFQLGMDFTTSREVAINLGSRDYASASYSYDFIKRFTRRMLSVAIAAVVIIAAFFFAGIGIPVGYSSHQGGMLVLLFGAFQILNFLVRPYTAVLIGSNFQNVVNINNVAINIATTLLGYLLLRIGVGIYSMPVSLIAWSLLNIYLLDHLVERNCTWIQPTMGSKDKSKDKNSIKFGVATVLGGVAWTVEATADILLLNAVGLMSMVGLYVIWWRFPQMFFDIATRLTTSSYPSIAAAHGRSKTESTRILTKLLVIISGVAFIIASGICLWLPSFINLWVGFKFYYEDYKIFSLLIALVVFFRVVGNCMGMFLISTGKVKVTTGLSWIQAFIKVAMGLMLIKDFGVKGLMIASLVSSLIQVGGLGFHLFKEKYINLRLLFLLGAVGIIPIFFYKLDIAQQLSIASFIVGVLTTVVLSTGTWYVLSFFLGYRKLVFNR